jgi:hypothetical protein
MKSNDAFVSRQHHRPRPRLLSKVRDRVEFDSKWRHADGRRRPFCRIDLMLRQTSCEISKVKQRSVQTASRKRLATGSGLPAKLLRELRNAGRSFIVGENGKKQAVC